MAALSFLVIITLFILIDFFIHIDTINMDLPNFYLKGSQVEISTFLRFVFVYSFIVVC